LLACGTPAAQDAAVTDVTADLQRIDSGTDAPTPEDTMDVAEPSGQDVVADEPPLGDPLTWSPRARGPFHIGYRQVMHTYTPRGSMTPRTIPVHLWYPTRTLTGRHPTYARLVMDPESIIDAPLAASVHPGGYPVHVYSHGDRGFAGTSAFLMRYFASHGWVCAAPDHVGNTLPEPVADPRPYALYHLRSQDVSGALNALTALPASDPLSGRMQTMRTVLSGHSFGTHTVWASAGATFDVAQIRARCTAQVGCTPSDLTVFEAGLRDARFVAVIPMAGSINRSLFGATGHSSVTVPLLAMSGTADPVGADAQFATTDPMPMHWIDVRDGCHQFFALGSCGAIADSEQEPIVGAWALAFARRHILADNSAAVLSLLDGSMPVSDRVTLHRR
jgi:predicted dienelactone hydrolase